MRIGMLTKLAFTNIKKRSTVYFPYFLSFTLLMSLEYIMASLLTNEFVRERHATLPTIMAFARFLSTILITIFTIYANNFIQKQRRLEYGLYTVLGLERKHISLMMFIEQIAIWLLGSTLANGIGFVFGKLFFMFINRLMKDNRDYYIHGDKSNKKLNELELFPVYQRFQDATRNYLLKEIFEDFPIN